MGNAPVSKPKRGLLVLGCLALFLWGLALLGGGYVLYRLNQRPATPGIVLFQSPLEGAQLAAGEAVPVRAVARSPQGVSRVELWVDGRLFHTLTAPAGTHPTALPVEVLWLPAEGPHALVVRAYAEQGEAFLASVHVTATAVTTADRDDDGIADAEDACPDQAGLGDGCPAPSAADRDGDGLLDTADLCPDTPAAPTTDGCPDADADGVSDPRDACPAEWGAGFDGCPAPEEVLTEGEAPEGRPGAVAPSGSEGEGSIPPGGDGPPAEPPGDGDDGIPPGGDGPPAEPPGGGDGGIPPGGDGPPAEPPPADAEPALDPGPGRFFSPDTPMVGQVEIDLQPLHTDGTPYVDLFCYLRVDDDPPVRFEFERIMAREGEEIWSPAEVFGPGTASDTLSLRFRHDLQEPLGLRLECLAHQAGRPPLLMGVVTGRHAPETWDGRVHDITLGGAWGTYRVCHPSCEEAALPPPVLQSVTFGLQDDEPVQLHWQWDGRRDALDYFELHVDSSDGSSGVLPVEHPTWRSLEVSALQPACDEHLTLQMRACQNAPEGGPPICSPWSNRLPWDGIPCINAIEVTFVTLRMHDLPSDQGNDESIGPIIANFWVTTGGRQRKITLWAWDSPNCRRGMRLTEGSYSINRDLFGWVRRELDSCIGQGCPEYHVPASNTIVAPYEPGLPIYIGASIDDWDCWPSLADWLLNDEVTYTFTPAMLRLSTASREGVIRGPYADVYFFIRPARRP